MTREGYFLFPGCRLSNEIRGHCPEENTHREKRTKDDHSPVDA